MKKYAYLSANICFVYIIILLCFTGSVKDEEVITNKNDNIVAKSSSNIKTTPAPSTATPINQNISSDWYIGCSNPNLTNILITGLEDRYNSKELQIFALVNSQIETYASTMFVWSSSNNKIATVDCNGHVMSVSTGAVTISVEREGKIKTYDINIYSSNKVELIVEVDGKECTSEINIDTAITLNPYFIIRDINYIFNIYNYTSNSSDTEKLRFNNNSSSMAVSFKTGKVTITVEAHGKIVIIKANILQPNLNDIKQSNNGTTYYMKVYDKKPESNNLFLETKIASPFQIILPLYDDNALNVTQYIDWKSTDPNISSCSQSEITAKKPGSVKYTGKYFDYEFTFNVEVTKGEAATPILSNEATTNNANPPLQDPIYPFEKDNPSPMSEINKKIIYALKDNINDDALISDANKDNIRINTIQTGYFTQQINREIIVSIHLEVNNGSGKIYKEIVGIFDSETFKYKAHKVFTAMAPNSIEISSTSILFIPIDPEHDYMANTIEIWTVREGIWRINWKPMDTQYHRYAIRSGYNYRYITVFDKIDKKDCEWEFKYTLKWDRDNLIYCKELYDYDSNSIYVKQAINTNIPENQNSNYADSDQKISGLHVICNNLIYNMNEFVDDFGRESIYDSLRNPSSNKSQIASQVRFKSIEYGYFTQTQKLEVLVALETPGHRSTKLILIVCDPETYKIIVQDIYETNGNKLDIYNDQTGKSKILLTNESDYQGFLSSRVSLFEFNASSIDEIWAPSMDKNYLYDDAYSLVGDKIMVVRKVYLQITTLNLYMPWDYKAEYQWDAAQQCFVES